MLKSRIGWSVALGAAVVLSATAHAAGPITFGAAAGATAQAALEQRPGITRAVLDPVTPIESERAIQSRTLPKVLNPGVRARSASSDRLSAQRVSGDAAAAAPASIAELARALRGSPDLIYEYVRNNIEYVPIWGVQKGALGTILDNQGTSFDQSALMVELLRQSGYTASYVLGSINLTAAQVTDWLGIDTTNVCAVIKLLGSGQVPIGSVTATASGSCPGSTAALVSLQVSHVWVKVNIGGTNYYFDPSYKPHTRTTGVNLATATGYNASSYLTAATSGATITADYVQNINRTNIRSNLSTYANNLASYLRTNKPAGTLDDLIGGMTITPAAAGNVRQATLPYQNTAVAVTEWPADIPANYKPTLRVQYSGIDASFTSDAIYSKRLSITYNGSSQPVLMLDGTVAATGSPVTLGSVGNVNLTVTHSAYANTNANQAFTQQIKAGGTFVIGNAWGPTGRGVIEQHRTRLEQARASGVADGAESTLGSMLAQISSNWIAQTSQAYYIHGRLARTNTVFHHQVGIAGYNTSPFVDLPGNVISVVNQDGDVAKEFATFFSNAMHGSILESTAVQQTSGTSAVSTVKLVDMAVQAGDKIFNATSANYASAVQPNLTGCTGAAAGIANYLNAGYRVVLPARCNLNEGSWTGAGFYGVFANGAQYSMASIISGGLAGGFGTSPTSTTTATNNAINTSKNPTTEKVPSGQTYADPIDMARGNFLYSHDDIATGVDAFPTSLTFNRLYNSGLRSRSGPLGNGWTHNFAMTATRGSDGLQAMGEDSALDAAAAVTEAFVSLDLMSDTTAPASKIVIATLGQRWYGEQLIDNTVAIAQGLNVEIFTRLADGSYNAPPKNSAKLVRNADLTFTYETANKALLNFNAAGAAANYLHPSGVQVNFTYSGNDLSQVANSLGRILTLTSTSGRMSSVSDGSRSVQYGYDASGNLTSYTDANAKATTFQYDLPGRITKVFYPSNPTVAFATNTYDTLDRVQTQTDANGKLYTYFFAGTRSEETGPLGLSRVSYLNSFSQTVKDISPTGKTTLNTYDGQNRLIRTILPEGNSFEYEYDDVPCAAQTRCTHNVKTVRQLAKSGSGLATLTRSFTYESNFNKVATTTDARGQITSYLYTAQGLPQTVTSPADAAGVQPVTTYAYTAFAGAAGFPSFYLQTSITQKTSAANTVQSTTSYNAANKYVPQTVVADAGSGKLNLTTTLAYDGVGNLTNVDGPRTDVTDVSSTAYDLQRRPTQSTDALGKLSRTGYDADGRVIRTAAQIGAQWLVSCRTYTLSGKLLKAWGPALTAADTTCPTAAAPAAVVDYAYDDLDRPFRVTQNLTAAEGGNRVSETTYNLDGSVASEQRAVGTSLVQTYAAYTYSDNGLVLTSKDAKNNLTTQQYDGLDRLLQRRFPDPVTVNTSSSTDYEEYGYDANSNLTSLRKRNGQSIVMAYDNLNRVTGRTYPTAADNVSYTYDLLGRRLTATGGAAADSVSYSYDNAGRLTDTTARTLVLSYQYDAAGNRTRMTWPDATPFYVTTEYDALNRPTVIKELGSTNLASYAYDDLSRRVTVTRGNATTTSYGYDTQSALSSLAHDLAGTAQDISYTYARNQAREITGLTWSNDLYQWAGVAGNATNGTRSYASNGRNQYTTAAGATPTYDGNGNITSDGTWTYGYDLNNRLKTAVSGSTSMTVTYDAEGRMRQFTSGGAVVNQILSGTDVVYEYDGGGNLLNRFVYGPGVDEPLVGYTGAGTANKSYLYADQIGSVVGAANASGASTAIYSYGPYGEPNTWSGARHRYTGQQRLVGLYYYKARFYSPTLGRFLQTDPIGTADDMNLYAYVRNNPVNFTDPTGLITMAEWKALLVIVNKYGPYTPVNDSNFKMDPSMTGRRGETSFWTGVAKIGTNPNDSDQYSGSVVKNGQAAALLTTALHENVHQAQANGSYPLSFFIDSATEKVTGGNVSAAQAIAHDILYARPEIQKEFLNLVNKFK